MISTWLDIVLLAVLLLTLILGLIKGFVRQILGIIAVVAGLVLAAHYYPLVSRVLSRAIVSERWVHLLSFFLIFVVVLIAGWLLAFSISKLMRGPLRFLNHLLGGFLGLAKGVLICGVIVFALLVFPVDRKALLESRLAPYCYWITKGIVQLIPRELKEHFKKAYEDIVGSTRTYGKEI